MGHSVDPTLRPRSPHSFIVDDTDALERWLLHKHWVMRPGVNDLERCRFTKPRGQILVVYRGGHVVITGQQQNASRAELAELLEEVAQ